MKKILFLLFSVLTIIFIASCGGNSNSSNTVLKTVVERCPDCDGNGYVNYICDDCEGTGLHIYIVPIVVAVENIGID